MNLHHLFSEETSQCGELLRRTLNHRLRVRSEFESSTSPFPFSFYDSPKLFARLHLLRCVFFSIDRFLLIISTNANAHRKCLSPSSSCSIVLLDSLSTLTKTNINMFQQSNYKSKQSIHFYLFKGVPLVTVFG